MKNLFVIFFICIFYNSQAQTLSTEQIKNTIIGKEWHFKHSIIDNKISTVNDDDVFEKIIFYANQTFRVYQENAWLNHNGYWEIENGVCILYENKGDKEMAATINKISNTEITMYMGYGIYTVFYKAK